MRRHRIFGSTFLLALALTVAGCEKQAPGPAEGTVKASPAYVESFGLPPTAEKGQCFARVGYFPLRSDPEKVRPVPLFLFREKDQLQLLVDRLASGQIPMPGDGSLFDPFPPGTRVSVQEQKGVTVTLNLTFTGKPPLQTDLQGMAAALTETATQFPEVERVVILGDGQPLKGFPAEGFAHDPAGVTGVGAPVLLNVVGSWESGSSFPEEIVANFDRPVNIASFRLEDANGQELKGDYFQSVFNMSVVLHPADEGDFQEGMQLHATWEVTDNLGREGKGSGGFRLQRHEHPAASERSE